MNSKFSYADHQNMTLMQRKQLLQEEKEREGIKINEKSVQQQQFPKKYDIDSFPEVEGMNMNNNLNNMQKDRTGDFKNNNINNFNPLNHEIIPTNLTPDRIYHEKRLENINENISITPNETPQKGLNEINIAPMMHKSENKGLGKLNKF